MVMKPPKVAQTILKSVIASVSEHLSFIHAWIGQKLLQATTDRLCNWARDTVCGIASSSRFDLLSARMKMFENKWKETDD